MSTYDQIQRRSLLASESRLWAVHSLQLPVDIHAAHLLPTVPLLLVVFLLDPAFDIGADALRLVRRREL